MLLKSCNHSFTCYDIAPGVWYKTVGTGGPLSASTCTGNTDFDSTLTVFTNACDDEPSCVAANDEFCGTQSKVTWDTVSGQEYFVLVHAFFSDAASGSFELLLEEGDSSTAGGPSTNPISNFFCTIRAFLDQFLPGDWSC